MKLRSKLDGRYAGSGITYAFREENEVWRDKKVKYVRMPNELLGRDQREKEYLSSPIITYKLSEEELAKYRGN